MKSVTEFIAKKNNNQKISMITCYDYTSAKIVAKTKIDTVLIGDSSSMVMHGAPDTTHSTLDQIAMHTNAVKQGCPDKFIVADLPFMTYRKSLETTMNAVEALAKAGAQAVKLEGVEGNLECISHIVASGVPVMGHIGLTPQHIHTLGGFKVQGKTQKAAEKLMQQARALESAGCFAIVLECVPSELAASITQALSIPTIGIGAGSGTDGQVLVFQDLLGLQTDFKPKFLKTYLNGAELFRHSIDQFVMEVLTQQFPLKEHAFEGGAE